ncbi:MAG: hypothetical protein O9301_17150 [Leptospira sp.]|nr:hypothetical protein [Leptospira sp.]
MPPKTSEISPEPLPRGVYIRPSPPKSPMMTKDFQLIWKEEIQIQEDHKFLKTWMEWRTDSKETILKFKLGRGEYEKSGPWVLLHTKEILQGSCQVSGSMDLPKGKDWFIGFPCEKKGDFVSFTHKLLYHFRDKNLVPLKYESGYVESDFGIVWESNKAYTEDLLFEKARTKFTKKEFQPHVYYHVKLD